MSELSINKSKQPTPYPKPNVSRFLSRSIPVRPKPKLEAKLLEWMQDLLNHTRHPSRITARYLVGTASGINDLDKSPVAMKIGGEDATDVHARFTWGGMADGHPFVERVWFSLDPDVQRRIAAGEQAELKARLLAEAEERNRNSPRAKAFPVDQYRDTWPDEIKKGAILIQSSIDIAYQMAKEMAYMPDNPYTPQGVALNIASDVLGKAPKGSLTVAKGVMTVGKKGVEVIKGATKNKNLQEEFDKKLEPGITTAVQGRKSAGDLLAERVIEKLPMSGGVKFFAAIMFHWASANYANEIVTVRGHGYGWYIAGFIEGVTGVAVSTPPDLRLERDKNFFDRAVRFYERGKRRALSLTPRNKFQAQAFLLWYTFTHKTEGVSHTPSPKSELDYPAEYVAHWQPLRMGLAFTQLLKRKDYLND
jgi:hypothetical protein